MIEPRGQELIERYKRKFAISINANITENMILEH